LSFVTRRVLRSPASWVVVGGVAAILVAAVVDAVRSSSDPVKAAPRSALDTNGVTEGTTITDSVAPTSEACESWSCWAQEVAIGAGYEVVGTTGSAWVVRERRQDWHRNFYFWVTPGRAPGLGDSPFLLVRRMGDVAIFGDAVRFAWRLRGATAWVEAVGPATLRLRRLNPLVATSSSLAALDPPG
jgi:hypothetical protein